MTYDPETGLHWNQPPGWAVDQAIDDLSPEADALDIMRHAWDIVAQDKRGVEDEAP